MDPNGSREVGRAAELIGRALLRLARQRPDVRDALLLLAREIEADLSGPSSATAAPLRDDRPRPRVERVAAADDGERPASRRSDIDLDCIIGRTELKARGCRWAAVRRRRIAEGADVSTQVRPTDAALREEALRLRDCTLWMLDADAALPGDELLEQLAGAYENIAVAARRARVVEVSTPPSPPPADFYRLVAEAQSALLAALDAAGIVSDRDQQDLFQWLRDRTARERVFIERYMKRTDPAPFVRPADLRGRLERWHAPAGAAVLPAPQRTQLVNKVKYHLGQLEDDPLDGRGHHWRKVAESIQAWIEAGGDPADGEFATLLRSAPEPLPADIEVTPEARRVLGAIAGAAASATTDQAVTGGAEVPSGAEP